MRARVGRPDLVTVSVRCPQAVICLISALAFHELTTQIPHAVSIAVPRDSRPPSLAYPPVVALRFARLAYEAGIETRVIDGAIVKIYGPEKTLADCFKFHHQIGMDIVLEALKLYRARRSVDLRELLRYARICRVKTVMRPYLEASQ